MEKAKAVEEDSVTLPADPRLDPARTNIFRARIITINGVVLLAGQSIALYASEVVFADSALIDTSGGAPEKDFSGANAARDTSLDGSAPGQDGKPGDSGSPGKSGGAIRIWAETITGNISLKSAGGYGGTGRDGGRGHSGQDAPNTPPPDKYIGVNDSTAANAGQQGGPGGSGGYGGASGDGGLGGNIDIAVVDTSSFNALQGRLSVFKAAAVGGQPGQKSKGGTGGKGGSGQPGGLVYVNEDGAPTPMDKFKHEWHTTSPNGPPGTNGKDHTNDIKDASGNVVTKAQQTGADGTVQIRQITLAEFARYETSSHLSLLLQSGQASYRNSDFTSAAQILGYTWRMAQQRGTA